MNDKALKCLVISASAASARLSGISFANEIVVLGTAMTSNSQTAQTKSARHVEAGCLWQTEPKHLQQKENRFFACAQNDTQHGTLVPCFLLSR